MQYLSASGNLGISDSLLGIGAFLGNKNCALLLATFFSVWLLISQKKQSLSQLATRLETGIVSAGIIILITSAGGAFGKMLARTGISELLAETAGGDLFNNQGILYILLAWGLTVTMKIAQGSGYRGHDYRLLHHGCNPQ